jgi:hypothetical protein
VQAHRRRWERTGGQKCFVIGGGSGEKGEGQIEHHAEAQESSSRQAEDHTSSSEASNEERQ